jgi:hypothetical protein
MALRFRRVWLLLFQLSVRYVRLEKRGDSAEDKLTRRHWYCHAQISCGRNLGAYGGPSVTEIASTACSASLPDCAEDQEDDKIALCYVYPESKHVSNEGSAQDVPFFASVFFFGPVRALRASITATFSRRAAGRVH